MRSKRKLAVTAVIVAVMLTIIVPSAYGVQPENAGTLYSVYLDWLQGKPVGLAQINIQTDKKLTNPRIVVIDLTSQKSEQKYFGSLYNPTVKIERKPMGTYLETEVTNGKTETVEKVRFKPVTLLIIVADEDYWGARTVSFEPNKPMTSLTIEVPLHYEPAKKGEFQIESGETIDHGTLTMEGIKTAIVRSIAGVTVSWVVGRDDAIAYESFSQETWGSPPDENSWESSGIALVTKKDVSGDITVSDGDVRVVTSNVDYKITETRICTYLWCRVIWSLTPDHIRNFHGTPWGHYSGGIPSGMPTEYRDKNDNMNSFNILFDAPSDNGGVYFTTSISVSVCGGIGVQVCFSGSVSTYRKSESGYRPHYNVQINNWGTHSRLYYAYKDSNGRNYYEIYLEWD
ncbi:hypothetical protein [Thermococcus sp. MAR1]|uniref:hypothetical protein n=1 Tax=Thermococcus sp. MAR1 TaxID=1638263 RepID=UPI001F0E6284|nr:hypothetical protein [Thermococcus sp. MAR1]